MKKQSSDAEKIQALFRNALTLHQSRDFAGAKNLYQNVLEKDKRNADAWCNLGLCHQHTEAPDSAMMCYNTAIAIAPDFAGAFYNRGALLKKMNQLDAALADYNRAIAIQNDFTNAHNNKGIVLTDLSRLPEAIDSFTVALQLNPRFVEAYNNRGVCHWKLKQYQEALANYNQALALQPAHLSAHVNRATLLFDLKQYDEANVSLQKAKALQPDNAEILALELDIAARRCDWSAHTELLQKIEQAILAGKPIKPFTVVTSIDNPVLQRQAAKKWADTYYPDQSSTDENRPRQHDRIRVGYLSADFHEHATSFLMAQVFECHNRAEFELYALSVGPDRQDAMRERLLASFEHFSDCSTWSDAEVIQYIREQEIDILIDMKGYTQDARTNVLTHRPAPIQINFLGYPGTMGSDYMDYIIADDFVVPEKNYPAFSEKIISLPGSYQCNDGSRIIDAELPSRTSIGLPENGFVFCCFNYHYKITPDIFGIWMQLLKQKPDSVLWLFADNETARTNIRIEAEKLGIHATRIVFADRLPPTQHLSRIRQADLFLDTAPCNAHTTASDALWAGVPLLTYAGESFCSRVAGSLLHALGLPELACSSLEKYKLQAQTLASDPATLSAIRKKLDKNKNELTLFNAMDYSRKLESAYKKVFHNYQAGLSAAHIRLTKQK